VSISVLPIPSSACRGCKVPHTVHDTAADATRPEAETRGPSVGATPAPLAWSTLARHRSRAETLEGPTSGPPCGGLQSYGPHPRHHRMRSLIAAHSSDVCGGCGDDAKARDHDAAVCVAKCRDDPSIHRLFFALYSPVGADGAAAASSLCSSRFRRTLTRHPSYVASSA
jgi:hypothetical protein